jgi:hypothetical protein
VKSKSLDEWNSYVKAHPNDIKPIGEQAGAGQ